MQQQLVRYMRKAGIDQRNQKAFRISFFKTFRRLHASGNGTPLPVITAYPWTHRFRCNGCLSEDRLEETGRMCDFTGGFLPWIKRPINMTIFQKVDPWSYRIKTCRLDSLMNQRRVHCDALTLFYVKTTFLKNVSPKSCVIYGAEKGLMKPLRIRQAASVSCVFSADISTI